MTTPVEMSFPFRVDPSGGISVETNPDQQVINHVLSLVGTQPTERVMLATYGVPTMMSVFEPNDDLVAQHLTTVTTNAANLWEPGVTVLSVTSETDVSQPGLVDINVTFTRVNTGDTPTQPTQVFTATIKSNGDIR